MTFIRPIFLTVFSLLMVAQQGFCAAQPSPELPVATFFQTPALASLTFSPNGKYIACLVPYEHRLNLAVIDLEKGTKSLLTNFKDKQAVQPLWANDNRILFRVDDDGKESYSLYAVNRDGKDPVVLASGYSKFGSVDEINSRFGGILGRLDNDPSNILVLGYLSYADWPDVAILNVKSGKMRTIVPAPGDVDFYVLDHAQQVRLAVVRVGEQRRVVARQPNGEWVTLSERKTDDPGWEPLMFDGDNQTLFVTSNLGRKTRAIYRYDLAEKKMLDLVFADETYDAGNPIYDRARKKIVGFAYEADRRRFHWIDPTMQILHEKIQASLPDGVNFPSQFSEDGTKIIFYSYSDRDPGVYYLYDKTRTKMSELAVVKPAVDPDRMVAVKPVEFPARDGLPLHGYLALPKNGPAKNLPLILHPHGGPYGIRDDWGFDAEVQFYANRGFAVLQINYRGSGGYGDAFEAAGFKKWGLEMQNDLTDGVKWAIAQGIADPRRIVISGASYGGYATLAGLTLTPDLYCAGINYVGLSDIELFVPKAVPERRMQWWNTRIGDLGNSADRKRLHDTSPVNLAANIQAPLLMGYGRNDPRVNIEQGYSMERALKRAGKKFEMVIEDNEGHGFQKEETSIAFFSKVDNFLKKNVSRSVSP